MKRNKMEQNENSKRFLKRDCYQAKDTNLHLTNFKNTEKQILTIVQTGRISNPCNMKTDKYENEG